MRLFVTGGAGFIGARYVQHVLDTTDDTVTVFDALTYAGLRANLAPFVHDPRVRVVEGDVCDRPAVERAMAGHDQVVHFAAETHVDRSLLAPDRFLLTNTLGTAVVCNVAGHVGIERFVQISTDEVYGEIEYGSFAEHDPLLPRSPYSASKASGDLVALSHHRSMGLPVVITRSSNVFGPQQFPEKMIPLFVTSILDGGRIPLYGDGLHVRDWLWIDDNCRAIELLRARGCAGEVYNIGAGNERTSLDVTLDLLRLLGRGPELIDHVRDRAGHDRRYSVDSTKIRSLGWAPQVLFDDALERTVRWYIDHEAWWRPLLPSVRLLRAELDTAFPPVAPRVPAID